MQIWRLTKLKRQGKKHGLKRVVEERVLEDKLPKRPELNLVEAVGVMMTQIISLSNDKGHFHPVQVTKAIEKEMSYTGSDKNNTTV